MADGYHQLGMVAQLRGRLDDAADWYTRSLAIKEEDHLARLTRQLGIPALEACWQRVTGGPLPGAVRDYVHAYRPDPGDTPEGAGR
jgi:hypothetical protein